MRALFKMVVNINDPSLIVVSIRDGLTSKNFRKFGIEMAHLK